MLDLIFYIQISERHRYIKITFMIHCNSDNNTSVLIKQNGSIKTRVKLSIHPGLKIKHAYLGSHKITGRLCKLIRTAQL